MIPTAIRTTLLACLTLHTLNAADPDPIRQTHRVPMRDGTHLATDVWLPAADQAYPVVLLRFPYNKDLAIGLGQDGTRQGYAVVAQDTRGRFASEGENLPFHRDVPDGKDTLAWIKQQTWCNGRIGTWGGSAGAITQFQMAIEGSNPLLAQYLVVGAPNLYDVVYTGGVFRKALIEDWLKGTQFATNALDIWVSHPTYDAYWQARDASRHYPKINTPALHVGGYWDIFAQPTIDAFNGYQNHGGPNARGKQKLLLGPWSHNVLQDKVGDLTFPNGKNPPGQHSNQWRWFDRWLKDQAHEIDTEPAVTYYVIGDTTNPNAPGNVWRTANVWPPLPATPKRYYLHHNHSLTTTPPAK
ncbi:MAG: CocE/NonD family hydrolase, partial [Limisphaerales bacterium]